MNRKQKIYKRNWEDYEKVIKDNQIEKLYHFTSRKNLPSIQKHGALFSYKYCLEHNITIVQAGGNDDSHGLDKYKGVNDFIHISFTKNHPMMYVIKIDDPIVFEIAPEVIYWSRSMYSDRNVTKNDAQIGPKISDFTKIRFDIVKVDEYRKLSNQTEKYLYKAEVMVKSFIPKEYILNWSSFK